MNFLEKKILQDGTVLDSSILKVDTFLNQQIDPSTMRQIGEYFFEYFKNKSVTKIVTIESSGIAPALMTAEKLNVPLVVCKKSTSKTLNESVYSTQVKSFTKGNSYDLIVSKKFINDDDNILIIDDFLATGEATLGIIRLIQNTNAKISGVGIVIEKAFQHGSNLLKEQGYDVCSIARIKSMSPEKIDFI